MKMVKRVIAVLCFCILVYLCGKIFRYILVDDTTSYTRIMMHEMYTEKENIDILFVGSSHCYRSFVPEITDKIFGKNTFNAGSSAQSIDASYYLIKEAAKEHDIEEIYLEMYYSVVLGTNFKNRNQMTSTYIVSDYMKPSLAKVEFLLNASSQKHYVNSFVVSRRDWEKIFDWQYIQELSGRKLTSNYREYGYDYVISDREAYVGKGYVEGYEKVEDDAFFSENAYNSINVNKMSEDWKKTFNKIVKFCDKENIELHLVSAPMSDYLLVGRGNYDEYVGLIKNLIKGTGIEYYDFNLCKEEYWPSYSSYSSDPSHLNKEGAERFSENFSLFFTGQISKDEMFYDTYSERVANLDPKVYGLTYEEVAEGGEVNVRIVSHPYVEMEYQIQIEPNEEEAYIYQDYSENKKFTLPSGKSGRCIIKVRKKDNPLEVIQKVEIPYEL